MNLSTDKIRTFFKPGKSPCSKSQMKKDYMLKKKRSRNKPTRSCPVVTCDTQSHLTEPTLRRLKEEVMPAGSRSGTSKLMNKFLIDVILKDESTPNKALSKEQSCSQITNQTELSDGSEDIFTVREKSTRPKHRRRSKCIIIQVKPINQEQEKDRFFQSNFKYNPQFLYKREINQTLLKKYRDASNELLPLAFKIMRHALARHRSYEAYEAKTGGRVLGRTEVYQMAREYLVNEGLESEIDVQLSDDLVARACMTTINRVPTLVIRVHNMRETYMEGVLRHEIGTHYMRSYNNKRQVWRKSRVRQDMGLEGQNPTEEGLASLHSVLGRYDPCLWRCALLYYTVCQAVSMSFVDLFKDLEQFVRDPEVRWDYCLRAKRGQTDSSKPGALCKDQVYLQGALQILRHRHDIDFTALMQYGKVSFNDLDFLKDLADTSETRIPGFMEDMTKYRMGLNDILLKNGFTDYDLRRVAALSL